MKLIKAQLDTLISNDSFFEASKINGKLLFQACKNMKAGKNDVSESFSSDAVINGPFALFEHLAYIFRSYLVHGSVSPIILTCAFLPLFKGGF